MAYQSNIPLATDQLSQSQGDINNNFQAISTLIGVNHVNFNQSNFGKHFFVEFPTGSSAGTTQPGPEVALYSNAVTLGSLTASPELFFQRNNLGANGGFPITATGSITIQSNLVYWTNLPSGVIVKWGQSATLTGAPTPSQKVIPLNNSVSTPGFDYTSTFVVFTSLNSLANGGLSVNNNYVIIASNIAQWQFTATTYLNGTATGGIPFSWVTIGI